MRRGVKFKPQANPPVRSLPSARIMAGPMESTVLGIPVRFDPFSKRIADARGLWPFKRIFVGPFFFDLSEGEKKAVVYHEIGHCHFLHLEKRLLLMPLIPLAALLGLGSMFAIAKRVALAQELEADRFAHGHGLGAELSSFLGRHKEAGGTFYPTNAARIEHLRRLK